MIETIIVILVVLWILGFSLNIAGGLIHLLLIAAVVLFVIRLIQSKRVV